MNSKRKDGYFRYWYKGKQFLGKTDQEAREKRDAYKYQCEHGIEQPMPETVYTFCCRWLETSKANVSDKTYNDYARIMTRLTDVVGDKLLSAVTPLDIKQVWKGYVGLSQSMIQKAEFLYSSMFKSAIENGYCQHNPVEAPSAKPHKGTKGSHRMLTSEEQELILTVPHRCQHGAMFMLMAGMRRGEVLALRKKDIHDGRIYINKAVRYVSNQPEIAKPKTHSSVRSVPLFDKLEDIYDDIEDYVLPDANGKICSNQAFKRTWNSYLHVLSLAAGHKINFQPHDLRHTFVSNCRDKGIDIHIVMAWVGHSSEKMILQIYDHITASREENAIFLMNQNSRKTVTFEVSETAKPYKSRLTAI